MDRTSAVRRRWKVNAGRYTKNLTKLCLHFPVHTYSHVLLPFMPSEGFSVYFYCCLFLHPSHISKAFHCRWFNKQSAAIESCFIKESQLLKTYFFHPMSDLNQRLLEPNSLCIIEFSVSGSNLQLGMPMEGYRLPCRSRRVVS